MSVHVSFEILADRNTTRKGQHIRVVGDCRALGNWKPELGLVLVTNRAVFPVWWSGPIVLPNQFKWKLVVCTQDGFIIDWEPFEKDRIFQQEWGSWSQRAVWGHLSDSQSTRPLKPLDTNNFGGEYAWGELEKFGPALSSQQRRAAQGLLGLAVGDAAGLPFEFKPGPLEQFLGVLCQRTPDGSDEDGRVAAQAECIIRRATLERAASPKSVNSPFARPFSDDTVCTDSKMQAIVLAELQCQDYQSQSDFDELLFRHIMKQYLTWCHQADGHLFQGFGGFTRDLLRPCNDERRQNFLGKMRIPLYEDDSFEPTPQYLEFAKAYFQGKVEGSFPSYGNGAVMSLLPQVILDMSQSHIKSAYQVLQKTHLEGSAMLGANLLHELLRIAIEHEDLAGHGGYSAVCVRTSAWEQVQSAFGQHVAYPLAAFRQFLEEGGTDCSFERANFFVMQLFGENPTLKIDREPGLYGYFGQLLRICSNCPPMVLGKEPLRFSQRGLNSVIIGVWCVEHALKTSCTMRSVLERCVYVGGDTDTVGAVAGQLAGPLLAWEDVCSSYRRFVGLDGSCLPPNSADFFKEAKRPNFCFYIAGAAARRYFYRACLFASLDWRGLEARLPMNNPMYPGVSLDKTSSSSTSRPERHTGHTGVDTGAAGPAHGHGSHASFGRGTGVGGAAGERAGSGGGVGRGGGSSSAGGGSGHRGGGGAPSPLLPTLAPAAALDARAAGSVLPGSAAAGTRMAVASGGGGGGGTGEKLSRPHDFGLDAGS